MSYSDVDISELQIWNLVILEYAQFNKILFFLYSSPDWEPIRKHLAIVRNGNPPHTLLAGKISQTVGEGAQTSSVSGQNGIAKRRK